MAVSPEDYMSSRVNHRHISNLHSTGVSVGKTPEVFTVPRTSNVISSILSPYRPKSLWDIFILFLISLQVILAVSLPLKVAQYVLLGCFLFWRLCYNLGLGYFLTIQSTNYKLTSWARDSGLFDCKSFFSKFITNQILCKMDSGFNTEDVPIEFNTWLAFRSLVDLVLIEDFVSYVLFAACWTRGFTVCWIDALRISAGILLLAFNLWVKMDAHRVVKDYAWYWGDFFFLVDKELIFDGIFEMAPHPMYSVGYAGYYGASLLTGSYLVLFVSLFAHICQLCFLMLVENPHIEKTYNISLSQPLSVASEPTSHRELLVFRNFDLYRSADLALALLSAYTLVSPLFFPRHILVIQALLGRIVYSGAMGYILRKQSIYKSWTKHFVKIGESNKEAWRNWTSIYNFSMVLNYTSFAGLVISYLSHIYREPSLLRWLVGVLLIIMQIWTSWSIHDALGDFGWFFGDFFYPPKSKLSSTGIYRYLNNPERLLGSAAFWGCAVITNSRLIFAMALLSHICNIFFIQLVERPHMRKLYGDQVQKDAGLAKGIKRVLKPEWEQKVENISVKIGKIVSETKELIEEAYIQAFPKESVIEILGETRAWLNGYTRLALRKIAGDNISFLDPQKFHITTSQKRYHIGEPIKILWSAPENHSLKDWIGIYEVTHNSSREITLVGSGGCWSGISNSGYGDIESITFSEETRGEVIFKGHRLPWKQGVWEARYHYDKKHSVMAISQPFEIYVQNCDGDEKSVIERHLYRLFEICSMNAKTLSETDSKKMVYAIKETFGIEFSVEVVRNSRDVGCLAERICAAKAALRPFI